MKKTINHFIKGIGTQIISWFRDENIGWLVFGLVILEILFYRHKLVLM
jgi:hypothetical protein